MNNDETTEAVRSVTLYARQSTLDKGFTFNVDCLTYCEHFVKKCAGFCKHIEHINHTHTYT